MIRNIISGWWHYIFRKKKTEEKALLRLAICKECPSGKYKRLTLRKYKDLPKYISWVRFLPFMWFMKYWGCTLCGCPIEKKVRSMRETNRCPAGHWA